MHMRWFVGVVIDLADLKIPPSFSFNNYVLFLTHNMAAVAPTPPSAVSPDPAGLTGTATNHPSDLPPLSLQPKTLSTLPPSFISSISELKHLSDAIAAFQKQNECLRSQIDSLKASVLTLLPEKSPLAPASSSSPPISLVSEEQILQNQSERITWKSELERLCKNMCVRGVRKFLNAHLSDVPNLREELAEALSLAPNPPKLVLDCLGKFFLQGSKNFSKDSPVCRNQEAKIFILECFLLMMGMDAIKDKGNGAVHIEKSLMKEAEASALAWYEKMLLEGGVAKSNQMYARGLLVFVSCFGIPDSFTVVDIRDLAIVSNAKEITEMLHKSHVLMDKLPEIVDCMIKNKMEIEAVETVYSFGLEERFNPQSILTKYLQVFSKKPGAGSQASAPPSHRAMHRQLAALKSVAKCLQRNKIDPASILPEWQIDEKIATLEKEVKEIEREKKANKRKVNETETLQRSNNKCTKRASRNSLDLSEHQKTNGRRDNRLDNNPSTYSAPQFRARPLAFIDGPSTNHGIHNQPAQLMNHGGQPYLWHGDPNWVAPPPVGGDVYQFQFAVPPPYFCQP